VIKRIILYDFLVAQGGAEALTLTLLKGVPEAELAVAFKDDNIFSDQEMELYPLRVLSDFTAMMGWQSIKSIWVFRNKTHFLSSYQQVVYSGLYSPVAIKHHHQGSNIYYCHTLPRFVYDLKNYYWQQARWWQKPLLKFLTVYVKYHYERSIAQMDTIIANSDNVRQRIKRYLGREALVINPPIEVEQFNWIEQGDYYLSTARVEHYKRVELIVRTFMNLPGKKLVVASGGSDLERLKTMAEGHTNISFTGLCTDEQLKILIGSCIATIYIPHDEDFGMSPVESMAAGKPVIGVAEGGLLETVVPEQTGVLIQLDTEETNQLQLIKALDWMTHKQALAMREACEARSQLYTKELFLQRMGEVLEKA